MSESLWDRHGNRIPYTERKKRAKRKKLLKKAASYLLVAAISGGVGATIFSLSEGATDKNTTATSASFEAGKRQPNELEIADNVAANNALFSSIVNLYGDVVNGNDAYKLIIDPPHAYDDNGEKAFTVSVTIIDSITGAQVAQLRFGIDDVPAYEAGNAPDPEYASSGYFNVNTGGGGSEVVMAEQKSVIGTQELLGNTTSNGLKVNTALARLADEQLAELSKSSDVAAG